MPDLADAINIAAPVSDRRFDAEDLQEFIIADVVFRACRFTNCNFDDSRMRGVKFIACTFEHCSFKECVLEDCLCCEGETGTQWRYCDISKAEFLRSNLSLNKMIGCKAYLASFTDCALSGAKLDIDTQRKIRSQVIAGGARFKNCRLQYAEFSSADFRESVFESSDLRDCGFAGCNLTSASFRGSSLNNIDLTGATLDHADLSHATFDQLDLSALASFHAAVVTRDQHEALLASIGLITAD